MLNWILAPLRWLFTAPARWLGGARSFTGWSLPTRVSIVIFVFLLLCVIGYYAYALLLNPNGSASQAIKDPIFNIILFVLLVALPCASYFAVKSWLETEPSQFPDIDDAWNEGWTAVRRAGIEPTQTPIFLAYGVSTAKQADQVMEATDWELVVKGEPDGKVPLRWYANDDGIVIFLLGASATSKAQAVIAQSAFVSPAMGQPEAVGGIRGTLVGSAPVSPSPAPVTGIRGTFVPGSDPSSVVSSAPPQTSNFNHRGTIVASGPAEVGVSSTVTTNSPAAAVLDRKMLSEQLERLNRVCKLAAQARQPLCPINGCIAIVEWDSMNRCSPGQLSGPLRDDTRTIIECSEVHTPTVVFVTGLEDETGFTELVRRVGESKARENRFGHGFNHLAPTTPDQLRLLAEHACGAFEDWIYELFRHPDCLGRTKNDKLFALLCKIRTMAQPRVVELLSSLAGVSESPDKRGPLLCGAYFGAAGSTRIRQAFVRSVFDKLFDLEEDLEWTETAWRRDAGYRSIARVLIGINALLTIFIVGSLVFYAIR